MSDSIRIAFAGTPAFAVPALERLSALAEVGLVLTQPDRPRGRGRRTEPSAVKRAAQALRLRCEQPPALHDPDLLKQWQFVPDLLVVIAYGLLLPDWMLAWPRRACVNLHASLLPRWRGAAPIQHALLAGDRETGVSLMRIERALDRGPVYAMARTAIGATETAGELHDRLALVAADLIETHLRDVAGGRLHAEPQDDARATYAPKISKSSAVLDWRKPALELERQVRAFNPWPVAESALTDGRRLRIHRARAVEGDARAAPGTISGSSAHGIDVVTGRGLLRLEIVQPDGAKVMDAAAYLAAHRVDGLAFRA
ncbi:MAG TPA: methionyl-tRNA formyltransferase [Gammaproteobacteria bacterium]